LKPRVQRCKGEEGQAVVLVALAMSIFLIGAIGLAIDGSQIYAQFQMAQTAADASAQAGVLELLKGTNASSAHPFSTTGPFPCAVPPATLDLRVPCVFAQDNGFGTSKDKVTVSFPTSVSGVTLSTSFSPAAVSVTVQRTLPTFLIRLIGPSASTVQAKATAAILTSGMTDCVVTLGSSGTGVSITGSGTFTLSNCGMAIDSNSSSALSMVGSATLSATSIQIVGNYQNVGSPPPSPTPTINASPVGDPLASVPEPSSAYSSSGCPNSNPTSFVGSGTVTLSPGTYCSQVSIVGSYNVTFNPGSYTFLGGFINTGSGTVSFGQGTYVFVGGFSTIGSGPTTFGAGTYTLVGGGFSATGSGSLSGSNVTFYNTFDATHPYGPINVTGSGAINLSATTSGSEEGMLFFENRSASSLVSDAFTGSSNQTLTGAIYLPKDAVTYTGNGNVGVQDASFVVKSMTFTGSGNVTFDSDITQAGAAVQQKIALVN